MSTVRRLNDWNRQANNSVQSTPPFATTGYSYSEAGDLSPAVALFSLSLVISCIYGFQYVIARQGLLWCCFGQPSVCSYARGIDLVWRSSLEHRHSALALAIHAWFPVDECLICFHALFLVRSAATAAIGQ